LSRTATTPRSHRRRHGPPSVEFLLQALAACLTAGIGNIAATRCVRLTEVDGFVEGDINLLGIFDLRQAVRNGYYCIRASFRIRGDALAEVDQGHAGLGHRGPSARG
jgi:uncharacterized OsmC-like protein